MMESTLIALSNSQIVNIVQSIYKKGGEERRKKLKLKVKWGKENFIKRKISRKSK